MEAKNATEYAGRQMLRQAKRIEGKGQRCRDLSVVNRPKPGDGPQEQEIETISRQTHLATQAAIRRELKAASGNLVLAATKLGMSVSQLDAALRMNKPGFMQLVTDLVKGEVLPQYVGLSLEQVTKDIERRKVLYKSEALDELYKIATMPVSENAMQNQVKLMACNRLYQETGDAVMHNEMSTVLAQINAEFVANAPRLRTIRQTTREITFEGEAPLAIETQDEEES